MSAVISRLGRGLGKWLLLLLVLLLVIVLLAISLIGWLAGTDSGFQTLADQARQRIPGLSLDNPSGNLASGVQATGIEFENQAMHIEAQGLDSRWRAGCLLQRRFCVDALALEELLITLEATEADAPPPPGQPIELPAIALPIDIQIDELRVGRLEIRPPGEAPAQVIENIRLTARTEGSTLFIDPFSLQRDPIAASLQGQIELDGDYPLQLQLDVQADDLIESSDQSLQAQFEGSLEDLQVSWQGSGLLQASGQASLQPLAPTLPLIASLSIPSMQWPLPGDNDSDGDSDSDGADPPVLANATNLRIEGDMDDYELELDTTVSGAQAPETVVHLEGRANTERLVLPVIRLGTLGGQIRGDARLLYANELSWRTALTLDNLNPGLQYEGLEGALDGQILASGDVVDGQWSLLLDQSRVQGELRGFPLALNARLSKQGENRWTIDQLDLTNGANRLDAKGTITDTWAMDVDAELTRLQNFLPGLAGGFEADVSLRGPLAEPDATLSVHSRVLKWNELLVQNLDVSAEVSRAALEDSELAVTIESIQSGVQTLLNTNLSLTGTRAEHQLSFFVDGPQATSVDLQASGSLNDAFDWAGELLAVQLEVPAHTIDLAQPTALAWDQGKSQLTLEAHCWNSLEAKLCLEAPITATAEGQAPISLKGYDLSRLRPFLPGDAGVAGQLGASALLEWGATLPGGYRVTVDADIGEGLVSVLDDLSGDTIEFPYDQITLAATADADAIDTSLAINSQRLGDADLQVGLEPGDEDTQLNGQVRLDAFKLDFLAALVPQLDKVGGTLNAAGALSGTLVEPRFDGQVILSEPELAGETLPLSLDGGQLTAKIKGRRAFLEGKLRSGEAGTITLDGSANWQQRAWRAELKLRGKQLVVMQNPVQRAVLNPNINVRATPTRVEVAGSVAIPEAEIVVDDLPKGAATLSDDIVIVEEETAAEERIAARKQAPFELRVNLEVQLGDKVTVAAYGLDASLTGDIAVRLQGANPVQLGGEISVDGQYKQYGQNLKVTEGQILFVGPIDQTRLNLDAIREIEGEDRIAGLRITGRVEEPEIALFTDPADKGEEAILSYIVLGRDIGEQSDAEANLLASAALALTLRGGRDVGTRVAEALGIEEFALESRGRGDDTEVVVSGRLNDRLLLSYGQSVFEPAQTLYLRYDLSKKLYLEAANGAQSALDLFYNFSF